jgi:hypothetical protein
MYIIGEDACLHGYTDEFACTYIDESAYIYAYTLKYA